MYTPSEFNPRVLGQYGESLETSIVSNVNGVRFLDPNPPGEIVPHEDLFIYVSLRAKTKSKTLLTQTSNNSLQLSQMIGNGVDMIAPLRTETIDGGKLFKPKLQLTTDWTEIGAFKGSGDKLYQDFEGFGITNVDIEIKSQTTPKVTIDFIDVRGATLFEQGSCSPYGLFFNLPYPVFELTVKGYYGKAVNYYLNLVKFNSKFNSDTGNMECRAEFIGYSFAFLSDTIVSYVQAAQYLKEADYRPQSILREKYEQTKEFYNRGSNPTEPNVTTNWCDNNVVSNRCTTIIDLLKSLKIFDEVDKPDIISSPEYKELQDLIQLESDYKTYRQTLLDLTRELEKVVPQPILPTTSNGINKNSPLKFVDPSTQGGDSAANGFGTLTDTLTKKDSGILYKYFNKTSSGTLLGNIQRILTRKIGEKYAYELDPPLKCLLNTPNQFKDVTTLPASSPLYDGVTANGTPLNDLPWQVGMLDLNLGYKNVTNKATYLDESGYFLDLGYIIDDVDRELELLNNQDPKNEGLLTKKRREVVGAINNLVESKIGFKPTIRNIFTVLLCNTDAFMEILKDVAVKAEKWHDEELKNKTLVIDSAKNSNTGVLSGSFKVYPWPTYMVATYSAKSGNGQVQGTKEAYPGYKYPLWPECLFVEDFIKAFLQFKDDLDLLDNKTEGKPGYDNYMPINPLESRLWYPNSPIRYKDVVGEDEAYSVIGERLFISLDHSYFQPIRLTPDALLIPKIGVGQWNSVKTTTIKDDTIYKLGKIDAWNLVNSLDNKTLTNALVTQPSSQQFIDKVIASLKINGTLSETPATSVQKLTGNGEYGFNSTNTYYTYRTNQEDGGILLKNDRVSGPILIKPNPSDMFKAGSNNRLINILLESDVTSAQKINITNDKFSGIIKNTTDAIRDNTLGINFYTKEFTKKKLDTSTTNAELIITNPDHQMVQFDKPQMYSTLAMSFFDDIEFSGWWSSSDFNQSTTQTVGGKISSNMGLIMFWDPIRQNTISGINFLTIDADPDKSVQDIYIDSFFNKPTDTPKGYYDTVRINEWVPIELEGGVSVYPIYDGTPVEAVRNFTAGINRKGGLTTPLVTTPMWLDNVNNFREKVRPGYKLDETLQFNNLAYLYLHSLKMSPLISRLITDDGYLYSNTVGSTDNDGQSSIIWSLKAFNTTAGIAKVPKAWLLTLGAQLWRWKEFVGVDTTTGRWNKPLSCQNCTVQDKPTGNDPLVQPGYNSYDTKVRINSLKKNLPFRENVTTYLTSIYGAGTYNKSIPKSVFGSDYQKRQKGQLSGALDSDNMDAEWFSFKYYNFYKEDVGLIGLQLKPIPTSENIADDYSWPQVYIAPHHIPYVIPETFNDADNGNGSQFVFVTDAYLGKQDYQTIMSQNINGNNYNELDGNDTNGSTHRSKKEDGNLGMVIQYLPDLIKNQIVDTFTTWVKEEFQKLLPTIDPVNFGGSLTSSYKYLIGKNSPSAGIGNGKLLGLGSLSSAYELIHTLALDPESSLISLLTENYYILNSTPKIWYGYGDKENVMGDTANINQFYSGSNGPEFVVSKPDFEKYLTSFYDEYKIAKEERLKELEEQVESDAGLSGTILDDDDTKLGLYRTFKSLTDKWISGSVDQKGGLFFNLINSANGTSCGQGVKGAPGGNKTTLASHFQYVNRVMGDIGDLAVIDITKLNELKDNLKISLYQYIADLLVENEYLFFPLPAYVNLTGSGVDKKDLIDMFKPSLLDVKDIGCGPLFLSMYVGGTSRQLKFIPKSNCPIDLDALQNIADDSFSFSDIKKPEEISDPKSAGSDGYTAFKVLYGVENQNHFKNIQLDQSEFSETAESLLVIDKLSQQGGNDQSTKGQNLNSAYLTRSYSCTIESLGNMMIQPMSYFDLAGVPMFSGAYLITEVKHNFKPNNASTTFKGVRQPRATVPIVTDVALAMNLSFKGTKKGSGKSINSISGAYDGANGGSISKVQKQPGGKGAPTSPTGTFDNANKTQLDAYGNGLGITDKTDDGTVYKPNQPISKPIGNMVNSAYANLNVSTRGVPNTEGGNLGCASAVSIIFYRATGYALVGNSYITIGTTQIYQYLDAESSKPNSSWEKITNWKTDSKPGDIICTARGSEAGHIGVVATGNKIISNSSGGFQGDQKGQIELNYTIDKWDSVAKRNPTKTASFRYNGPYATAWGPVDFGGVTKLDTVQTTEAETKKYYETILTKLGAPITDGNILFLKAWRQAEGGKATWNGFNTTLPADGATNYNSAKVKNYKTLDQGAQAIVDTLLNTGKGSYYKNIVTALKNGMPNQSDAQKIALDLQQKPKDLFVWVRGPGGDAPLAGYVAGVLKGKVGDGSVPKPA